MITLIHPSINPVIVSFGELSIRWYGVAYLLGFIFGIIIIKIINRKLIQPLKNKQIDDFFIWAALGTILGGRIGYILFYQASTLYYEPLSIFYIWRGGMSFHGGLIGVGVAVFAFAYIKKINSLVLADLISTVAPIGIFFGRMANFINIELYGRVTNFPFAMIYPSIDYERRHPSQIYEAFFEGIVIFIILILISKIRLGKNNIGINTSIFLILYGVLRFLIEFLREPDIHMGFIIGNLTMGQILSIPMILTGLLIFYFRQKYERT